MKNNPTASGAAVGLPAGGNVRWIVCRLLFFSVGVTATTAGSPKVGLFASAAPGTSSAGHADFDFLRVRP